MTIKAGSSLSVVLCFTALALGACSPELSGPRSLEEIQASDTLVVLTRNAPTTYFLNEDNQPEGFEYDLVEAFAASLGVETEYIVKDTVGKILAAIKHGKADLAAAGLTVTEGRKENMLFGPTYRTVTQQVVCNRNGKYPNGLLGLKGVEVTVTAGSSHAELLKALQPEYPELVWRTADIGRESLLEQVWRKDIDCTVADSSIVAISQRYYPDLKVVFRLSRPQPKAWAMPKASAALRAAIDAWFDAEETRTLLATIRDRYYGFIPIFDYIDVNTYLHRIDKRYPRYREWFEQAAGNYDLPVTLLAAMAYQESHWNPEATSPTGVRGIMMLTESTAEAMDVEDRLDPAQSIAGGARYLAMLKERLSDIIEEPDRTYLALAAYNVGYAHLRDAQKLARKLDKDPHAWTDIKEVLPLLSEEHYYKNLEHGYARGLEPVRYVQRIRHYRDILKRQLGE